MQWVVAGCCHDEGAVVALGGEQGPSCVSNHRKRLCQSLDANRVTSLQVTAAPLPEVPSVEKAPRVPLSVACGQVVPIWIRNNSCANETFSDVTGQAGGTVTPADVAHYDDNGNPNADLRYTYHINRSVLYRAPDRLPNGATHATDYVGVWAGSSRSGSRGFDLMRIEVNCASDVVAPPDFYPQPGEFPGPAFSVVISCSTAGATIRYTTDGSYPTDGSPVISNPGSVVVTRDVTIRARGYKPALAPSAIQSGDYKIRGGKAATPVISPPSGTYPATGIAVTMTTASAGATIFYTLDGRDPDPKEESTPVYTNPISLNRDTVVKAVAVFRAVNGSASAVAVASYRFQALLEKVATPELRPVRTATFLDDGRSIPAHVQVFCATPGAEIEITGPGFGAIVRQSGADIELYKNYADRFQTRLTAVARKAGFTDSDPVSAIYVIKAVAPTVRPAPGPYTSPIEIFLDSPTPSAVRATRYTLDGSEPTDQSPLYPYPGPVKVCEPSFTVKAAVRPPEDVAPSDTTTAAFQCRPPIATCTPPGNYDAVFIVKADPAGHAPFVNLVRSRLSVTTTSATEVQISGSDPSTVPASGTLQTDTCTFEAVGRGTIAGFANILCEYREVKKTDTGLSGDYACGVGGGLPQNQPITYSFTAPAARP